MSDAPQRDASDRAETDASDRAETDAVRVRYARRAPADERYRLTNPAALMAMQERQRAMLALFARRGFADLGSLRLVEVGSGGGGNLLELLQLGFLPEHLAGIELLPERHAAARARLPEAVRLVCGDASAEPVAPGSIDIVLASTVFSSLLDDAFQQRLAAAMWQLAPARRRRPLVRLHRRQPAQPATSAACRRRGSAPSFPRRGWRPARDAGAADRARGLPRASRPLHSVQRPAAAAHPPPGWLGKPA